MTQRIAVIVPTRGRPQNAARLARTFHDTLADTSETQLIFGVDDDDALNDEYHLQIRYKAEIVIAPRLRMAGTLNAIAALVKDKYDIIGFMGDDHLPETSGWDDRIREAMTPGGVVYCNDLLQGANLPTAVFLDARIVRDVGGFVPEGFVHLFLDNVWKTWGERANTLTYLDDVIIEHLHPMASKTDWDEGYREVNSGPVWEADEKRFTEYVASGELDRDVQKIKDIANG